MSIPYGKIPGRVLLGDPEPDPVFHDANIYCYKSANGKPVLKGIVLAAGWENRPCGKLSCYNPIGQEAVGIAEFSKPRLDKDELTSKAKAILEADPKRTITSIAEELDVPLSTLHSWLTGKRQAGKPARNAPRERPDREDLLKVFLDGDMKVDLVRKHYSCSWNKAKEWLMKEGIIDMKNNLIADVADINVGAKEQLTSAPQETKEEVVEEVEEEVEESLTGWWKETATTQYEPSDNDYQPGDDGGFSIEDEGPVPYMIVEPEFNRQAFVLEMIEVVLEHSRNSKAPAELTVELIYAVLAVA